MDAQKRMDEICNEIKMNAENGKTEVVVEGKMTGEMLRVLKEAGYDVDKKMFSNKTTIKWE